MEQISKLPLLTQHQLSPRIEDYTTAQILLNHRSLRSSPNIRISIDSHFRHPALHRRELTTERILAVAVPEESGNDSSSNLIDSLDSVVRNNVNEFDVMKRTCAIRETSVRLLTRRKE